MKRPGQQIPLARLDPLLGLPDELEALGEDRVPGLGDRQLREVRPAGLPEQVPHRDRVAVGDQGGVDPVLEGGPVADQVLAEATDLPGAPGRDVGQL